MAHGIAAAGWAIVCRVALGIFCFSWISVVGTQRVLADLVYTYTGSELHNQSPPYENRGRITGVASFKDLPEGFTGTAVATSCSLSALGMNLSCYDETSTSLTLNSFIFSNGNVEYWNVQLTAAIPHESNAIYTVGSPGFGLDVAQLWPLQTQSDIPGTWTLTSGGSGGSGGGGGGTGGSGGSGGTGGSGGSGGTGGGTGGTGGHTSCFDHIAGATFLPVALGSEMMATFTISSGLAQAASDCGIVAFNWEQTIDILPTPNPFYLASDPTINAFAPPAFHDPVRGGWDTSIRDITCADGTKFKSQIINGSDSYPFYWDNSLLSSVTSTTTLMFKDIPANGCLSGLDWTGPSTSGDFMEFTTTLVGVGEFGDLVHLPATYSWRWITTYNGTAGGAYVLGNTIPADPGSGTGGTAIISINTPVSNIPEPESIILLMTALLIIFVVRKNQLQYA